MRRDRPSESVARKTLREPDATRHFEHGSGVLVRVADVDVGRATLEPGWRWSVDVKPTAGTGSCQSHHLHVVLSGHFAVQMDGGELHEFGPDDVVNIPPGHDAWVVGGEAVDLLDISGNVSDFAVPASPTRATVTMLMTDIVASTEVASRLGDARWKGLLADHNRVVRRQLDRFRGREINTTGDGFLAVFDSAGAALRAGLAIAEAVKTLALDVRIGVHSGEVELLPDDIRGIEVHTTARIMAAAGPGEVVASAITRMLASGAELEFEDRGSHRLKGIDDPVALFAIMSRSES